MSTPIKMVSWRRLRVWTFKHAVVSCAPQVQKVPWPFRRSSVGISLKSDHAKMVTNPFLTKLSRFQYGMFWVVQIEAVLGNLMPQNTYRKSARPQPEVDRHKETVFSHLLLYFGYNYHVLFNDVIGVTTMSVRFKGPFTWLNVRLSIHQCRAYFYPLTLTIPTLGPFGNQSNMIGTTNHTSPHIVRSRASVCFSISVILLRIGTYWICE